MSMKSGLQGVRSPVNTWRPLQCSTLGFNACWQLLHSHVLGAGNPFSPISLHAFGGADAFQWEETEGQSFQHGYDFTSLPLWVGNGELVLTKEDLIPWLKTQKQKTVPSVWRKEKIVSMFRRRGKKWLRGYPAGTLHTHLRLHFSPLPLRAVFLSWSPFASFWKRQRWRTILPSSGKHSVAVQHHTMAWGRGFSSHTAFVVII